METVTGGDRNSNSAVVVLLCFAIAVALFALGVFTGPALLVIVALFIPMAFTVIHVKSNVWVTLLLIVLFGAIAAFLKSVPYAVVAVACTIPVAVVSGIMIKKRTTFYYSVLGTCIAMLVALGVLVALVFYFWQNSLDVVVANYAQNLLEKNPEVAQVYYGILSMMQDGTQLQVTADNMISIPEVPAQMAITGMMNMIRPALLLYIPQAAVVLVMLFGLLGYIIPRAVVKKTGMEVGQIPVFSRWQLPRYFGTWSIVLLLLSYIGMLSEWHNFDLVYSIVLGILSVTYSIQGMALIDWLLKKKVGSPVGRVFIIAITFLVLSIWNVYMWIGFFEQIAKIRRRRWPKQHEEK